MVAMPSPPPDTIQVISVICVSYSMIYLYIFGMCMFSFTLFSPVISLHHVALT